MYVLALLVWNGIAWAVTLAQGTTADFTAAGEHAPLGRLLGAIVAAAISYWGYSLIVRRVERHPGAALEGPGKGRELLVGLVIGAAVVGGVIGVIALSGGYEVLGVARSPELLAPLASAIGAAVLEETFFRGFALRLLDEWVGTWGALLITALFFGFMHILNPGVGIWGSIAIAVQAGLLLGAAFLVTRRLWIAFGIHAAWNFLQSGVFSYHVGGNGSSGLLATSVEGPAWLTGGSAGLEGSVVTVAVTLVVAAVLLAIAWKRGTIRPAPAPRS